MSLKPIMKRYAMGKGPDNSAPDGMPSPREILDFVAPILRRWLPRESEEEIEDCTQEAYLKIWDAYLALREETIKSPEALMTEIAKRVAHNLVRRKVTTRKYMQFMAEPEIFERTDRHRFWTPIESVQAAVIGYFEMNDQEACAEIGRLFFQGYRPHEIAKILGEKPATVRQRWRRCILKLRSALKSYAEELAMLRAWLLSRDRDIDELDG